MDSEEGPLEPKRSRTTANYCQNEVDIKELISDVCKIYEFNKAETSCQVKEELVEDDTDDECSIIKNPCDVIDIKEELIGRIYKENESNSAKTPCHITEESAEDVYTDDDVSGEENIYDEVSGIENPCKVIEINEELITENKEKELNKAETLCHIKEEVAEDVYKDDDVSRTEDPRKVMHTKEELIDDIYKANPSHITEELPENVYLGDELSRAENACDVIDIKEELIGRIYKEKESSRTKTPCHITEKSAEDVYTDDEISGEEQLCDVIDIKEKIIGGFYKEKESSRAKTLCHITEESSEDVYTDDEDSQEENLCDIIDIKEELIGKIFKEKESSRAETPCHIAEVSAQEVDTDDKVSEAENPCNVIDIKEELIEYTYKDDSSSPSAMSQWTTMCELKDIFFDKQNEFYGVPNGKKPIDYFNFFFCNDFLEMICLETNRQAERLTVQPEALRKSWITRWKKLTVRELRIFLGLLFHMDIINVRRLQDYWKKDRLFSIPIFGEQMTRNRFSIILRCLHFTSDLDSDGPLVKINPVVNYFNNKMEECYYPARELSLNESKVLGPIKFQQCIKNVLHQFGIKLYMLTEPDGLVLKFQVYASKDKEVAGKYHADGVIMQLLQEKLNHGHSLYMNNFFNSFQLSKRLLDNNTYCTGKLCKNLNDNPKEVVEKSLTKGENVSRFQNGVHIGMWKKDVQPIAYITTQYEDKMVPVLNKCGEVILKPEAIAKYNEFMSIVKRKDQLLPYYTIERKTWRWYLKIGIHVFQLLFLNSYKIYNKYSGKCSLSFYDYRLSVINKLLPTKRGLRSVSKNISVPSRRRLHKISKIAKKNPMGKTKRKQCRQCNKKSISKDTVWHCTTCIEKPGLCVECFDVYHSKF